MDLVGWGVEEGADGKAGGTSGSWLRSWGDVQDTWVQILPALPLKLGALEQVA